MLTGDEQPKGDLKMRLIKLLSMCAAVLMITNTLSFSQTETTKDSTAQQRTNVFGEKARWGVGLHAGLLSGWGLGVRYHPIGRMSLQAVGFAWKTSDYLISSFGVEGQFDLDIMDWSRFYTYVGTGFYSNGKSNGDELKSPFRVGAGIAYEWGITGKLVLNLNLGFTYFARSSEFWPSPQSALVYYFR